MSARDDYPELGRIANGFGVLILEDAEEQAEAALNEIARLRAHNEALFEQWCTNNGADNAWERYGLDCHRRYLETKRELDRLRAFSVAPPTTTPADPTCKVCGTTPCMWVGQYEHARAASVASSAPTPPTEAGECDVTACHNEATWCDVGEAGDLWLCDDHRTAGAGSAPKEPQ